MTDFDDDLDAEEVEAARRLATALDGKRVNGVDQGAFEAAALLRVVAHPELEADREAAILEQVLAEAKIRPDGARPFRWPPLIWSALGFGATAMLLWVARVPHDGAVSYSPLPEPSVELVEAQAARLSGESSASYREELALYRGRVLHSLRRGVEPR